ncbi:hypothetical protein ABNQ38_05210 [Azospirillum sp. A29]
MPTDISRPPPPSGFLKDDERTPLKFRPFRIRAALLHKSPWWQRPPWGAAVPGNPAQFARRWLSAELAASALAETGTRAKLIAAAKLSGKQGPAQPTLFTKPSIKPSKTSMTNACPFRWTSCKLAVDIAASWP